jgi:DNA-binding NarL/FixJ family response regulator
VILVEQRLLDAPGMPALGTLAEMAGGAAVLVMGIDEGRAYVDAARRLGAVGYVVKLAPLDDWVSAVCAARRR